MTDRHVFRLAGGMVEVRDPLGKLRWIGRPDGHPASSVVPLPDSDEAIVLLDYMAGPKVFLNLLRLAPDGVIRWRAQLPQTSQPDAFVAVEFFEGTVVANTWSRYRASIDPDAGGLLSSKVTT